MNNPVAILSMLIICPIVLLGLVFLMRKIFVESILNVKPGEPSYNHWIKIP